MINKKVSQAELNQIKAAMPAEISSGSTAADSSFVKLFSKLDRKLIREIMTDQQFEAGNVIFCEGDKGDALYLIWGGHVAVVKGNLAAPTGVLFRRPGEVVGEMALLEDKPRWASLVALDDVRLLRIERVGFHRLLQAQPTISLNLLALLSSRLRAVHEFKQTNVNSEQQAMQQLSTLIDENEQLLDLQQVRQETSDLIVHDLRSPLNNMYSVLNMLELVLPEGVLAANRELLDIAKLAYSRMQDLVDSLLDVSKLESDELMLDIGPASIKQLVDEVVAMASFSIDQRSIMFQTHFSPNIPLVMVDEDRIRRVLTNLIDNAVKFTPHNGRIQVDVTAMAHQVSISIADSGPGIPSADRQRIFERFAQIERVGMRRTRGFGLGLAFCRLAIEAHGGEIWVEPGEDGIGSRFLVTLPTEKIVK
ncbi:MAG: cyclic nucleotide-binding domain-containing protein [Chloroflexi bacterium]|nr:cyclic nucleotide-binding domain-containing protein [Chloroflexota bacterium]